MHHFDEKIHFFTPLLAQIFIKDSIFFQVLHTGFNSSPAALPKK